MALCSVSTGWEELWQTWLDVRRAWLAGAYLGELACEPVGGDVGPLAGRKADAGHCLQQLHGCKR